MTVPILLLAHAPFEGPGLALPFLLLSGLGLGLAFLLFLALLFVGLVSLFRGGARPLFVMLVNPRWPLLPVTPCISYKALCGLRSYALLQSPVGPYVRLTLRSPVILMSGWLPIKLALCACETCLS